MLLRGWEEGPRAPMAPNMSALPILATVSALAAAAALTLELRWRAGWSCRDITTRTPPGRIAPALRAALAAAAGTIAASTLSPAAAARPVVVAIAATTAASLALLAVDTDLGSGRIPFEPCYAACAVGAVAMLVNGSRAGVLAAAAVAGFLTIMWLLGRLTSGLGMGDTRLLAGIGACCSWWAGAQPVAAGLMIACVLQLGVRGVLAARSALTAGRTRQRLVPFAPALVAGCAMSLLLAAHADFEPCQDWPSAVSAECAPTPLRSSR